MPVFRRKSAQVEAHQFTGEQSAELIYQWLDGKAVREKGPDGAVRRLVVVDTGTGALAYVELGDWVVRTRQGEWSVTTATAFDEIYESL